MRKRASMHKNQIVNSLSVQLQNMINGHEYEIQMKSDTIKQLEKDILFLKEQNKQLRNKIKDLKEDNHNKAELLVNYPKRPQSQKSSADTQKINRVFQRIKEEKPDNLTELGTAIISSFVEEELDYLLPQTVDYLMLHFKEKTPTVDSGLQLLVMLNTLFFKVDPNHDALDKFYRKAFDVIEKFTNTGYERLLTEYLKKNAKQLTEEVFNLNDTPLMDKMLKVYFHYGLNNELIHALNRLIEEWDYFKEQMSDHEFSRVLWYAFYVDQDTTLLNRTKSSSWLKSKLPEINAYFNYHVNNHTPIQEFKKAMDHCKSLTPFEKTEFNRKMKERFSFDENKQNNGSVPESEKDKFFKWPSTDVPDKNGESVGENNDNGLHEKSELRKLGYQITGLKREMRWHILTTKALPALGLQKTANLIAYHVRLRKTQKNGPEKFSYSINEWEYDLEKLRKQYYKFDFEWPNTAV